MAKRLRGRYGYLADEPFRVTLHPERLDEPLHWKKPQRVFVVSMGDLFHDDVPAEFVEDVFEVMSQCRQHCFLVLTKRPQNIQAKLYEQIGTSPRLLGGGDFLPNVWVGVTAENQAAADERIPVLLQVPAAKRFVSCEPLLGPVDLGLNSETCDCCPRVSSRWVRLHGMVRADFGVLNPKAVALRGVYRAQSNRHGALAVETPGGPLGIKPAEFEALPSLDWVICGGETGPGARPLHPDWARSLRDQCKAAGVRFFFKSHGDWEPVTPLHGRRDEAAEDERGALEAVDSSGHIWRDGEGQPSDPQTWLMEKVGKKAAGRLLDGREWNESPEVA
jgi:protein gp37